MFILRLFWPTNSKSRERQGNGWRLGGCQGLLCWWLIRFQIVSFPSVESSLVHIYKMLEYVVQWLGDIIRLTVIDLSYFKLWTVTSTSVSDNFVDNVGVIIPSSMLPVSPSKQGSL